MHTGETFAEGEGIGVAAATIALERVQFPISKSDLLARVGDARIEHLPGRNIPLRDLLVGFEVGTFQSLAFALAQVKHALREKHGTASPPGSGQQPPRRPAPWRETTP
jgi:hypothetical protein